MSVDDALMERLARADPTAAVEQRYGTAGMAAVRLLAVGLEKIGKQLAFELLDDGLTVFVTLDPQARPLAALGSAEVRDEQLPQAVRASATIQVLNGGIIVSDADPDLTQLSR